MAHQSRCESRRGRFLASSLLTVRNRNDCDGSAAQNWLISTGSTTIQVADSEFCLDAGPSTFFDTLSCS